MIEVKNVTKYYGNQQIAVDNLSFSVPKGTILGFLGPNGAGKTTTMRMLTGFMAPSIGSIEVGGLDTVKDSMEVRKRIGYLPETPPLYNELNIKSYLDFVARLKGIKDKHVRKQRIDYVAEACWISDVLHKTPNKLSKGYRQRVGIAQAIIHDPDVIVLDEPTIGLDPKQIKETRKLIKGLGGQHTIILSTHILPEVQVTCDQVVIINKGQILAEGTPQALMAQNSGLKQIALKIRGPQAEITETLQKMEAVAQVIHKDTLTDNVHLFQVESTQEDVEEQVSRHIVNADWGLIGLQTTEGSLEDVFIQLVTKEQGVN